MLVVVKRCSLKFRGHFLFCGMEAPDSYRFRGDKAWALWIHAEHFGVFLTATGCHPGRFQAIRGLHYMLKIT